MVTMTVEQLVSAGLAPQAKAEEVIGALNAACAQFDISTPLRVAGFLSQICQESDRFRLTVENLNYSAQGLLATFPKRVTPEQAQQLAHHPEAIGNHIYCNRIGNGPESSGDGYRFRGRGYIQLTGRDNYAAFGKSINHDVTTTPDLVAEPCWAALSAAWFWQTHGLNELADTGDIVAITKRVNGGILGLDGRKKYYEAAKQMLGI